MLFDSDACLWFKDHVISISNVLNHYHICIVVNMVSTAKYWWCLVVILGNTFRDCSHCKCTNYRPIDKSAF